MNFEDIRVFVPCTCYEQSILFYQAWGFSVDVVSNEMSLCTQKNATFFLYKNMEQPPNTPLMMQLIVQDIDLAYAATPSSKEFNFNVQPIVTERWGKVFYLTAPSGEIWHVTELTHQATNPS